MKTEGAGWKFSRRRSTGKSHPTRSAWISLSIFGGKAMFSEGEVHFYRVSSRFSGFLPELRVLRQPARCLCESLRTLACVVGGRGEGARGAAGALGIAAGRQQPCRLRRDFSASLEMTGAALEVTVDYQCLTV